MAEQAKGAKTVTMSRLGSLLTALFVALPLGCSGDDDSDAADGSKFSCRVESSGNALQCLEYTVPPEAATAARDGCTTGGGMLVAACPVENRLGTCTNHVGPGLTLVTRYYAGGLTLETAEQLCTGSGGTFAPG
jgi:hypothetical protein